MAVCDEDQTIESNLQGEASTSTVKLSTTKPETTYSPEETSETTTLSRQTTSAQIQQEDLCANGYYNLIEFHLNKKYCKILLFMYF